MRLNKKLNIELRNGQGAGLSFWCGVTRHAKKVHSVDRVAVDRIASKRSRSLLAMPPIEIDLLIKVLSSKTNSS